LGAGGRRFKSGRSHFYKLTFKTALLHVSLFVIY
jgi:hypothetical protein